MQKIDGNQPIDIEDGKIYFAVKTSVDLKAKPQTTAFVMIRSVPLRALHSSIDSIESEIQG